MAKALISPDEPRTVGSKVGARVVQVEAAEFFVAPPLYWVTCNTSIRADEWAYVENRFVKIPEVILAGPQEIADPAQQVIDVIREF